MRPIQKPYYAESLFLDSGAYGIYNDKVRKIRNVRIGKTGRELIPPKVQRGRGDFSYYTLAPGSEFRKYCDSYGKWLRMVQRLGLTDNFLFVNVDVITNPEMTWQVQQYLEKEHGVIPIPVIHAGSPLSIIQRYLDTGKYDLIGLGGLGQNIGLSVYRRWADEVFTMLCPKSNKYLPIVKVHGFAMTSWEFICRWPWFSVDSATWVKLAAYGWLYISRWTEEGGWDYTRPPYQVNVSFRSPFLRKRNRHRDQIGVKELKELVSRWLERCNLDEGKVDAKELPYWDVVDPIEKPVFHKRPLLGPRLELRGRTTDWGIISHFAARAAANLHYLKDLEESRPEWPTPLDPKVVWTERVRSRKGLGIV